MEVLCYPQPFWKAWEWINQQLGRQDSSGQPFAITVMEKYPMPPTPQIAAIHAALGVAGAVWVPIYYYTTNTQRRPREEERWKRNAQLQAIGSLIPAPIAAMASVAMMQKVAPWITGDYRYEWAFAFAGGTVAVAIIKRLQTPLLTKNPFSAHSINSAPHSIVSAPQGEEKQ